MQWQVIRRSTTCELTVKPYGINFYFKYYSHLYCLFFQYCNFALWKEFNIFSSAIFLSRVQRPSQKLFAALTPS